MFQTETRVGYLAFGMLIISEIPLPELPKINIRDNSFDLEVTFKDLSTLWLNLSDPRSSFVVKENFVMFQVPDMATFLIRDGSKIFISPLEKYDEDVIRLYLLGTCMGAILMQRKICPLHGSAIAINGEAYAIIGDSGAGKSTLASAFLNEGYPLLTDDVIAVSLSEEEAVPYVTPAYPQQKLWQESLDNFGKDSSHYRPIHGRETKYNVPVTENFCNDPLPLAGVFELLITNKNDIELNLIENLDRFSILQSNTFRNFLLPGLGLMDWHFHTSADILSKINVFRLQRPINQFSAPQLVSIIMNTIKKGK